jgi:hypothetical protein
MDPRATMSTKKTITEIEITPHRFVQFISKENLNLCRQGLTDEDMPEIIQFLQQYPDIKTLDLSLNNLGDEGIANFAERNLTVRQVNFSGNNIGDYGLAIFAYKNHATLHVNFSYNLISEQGIANFIEINEICSSSHFSSMRSH